MKYGLWLLVIILLTGCDRHYAGYDDAWVKPCPILPPPDGDTYTSADPEGREVMWTQVYIAQVKANTLCNDRLKKASDYVLEVKGLKP